LSIALFHVILSTLIIYYFSTFVRGLLSNLIKDYFYDFQLKPRVIFGFRGLNSLDILLRLIKLLSLLLFFRRCRISKTRILRGYMLRSAASKEVEDYPSYTRIKI